MLLEFSFSGTILFPQTWTCSHPFVMNHPLSSLTMTASFEFSGWSSSLSSLFCEPFAFSFPHPSSLINETSSRSSTSLGPYCLRTFFYEPPLICFEYASLLRWDEIWSGVSAFQGPYCLRNQFRLYTLLMWKTCCEKRLICIATSFGVDGPSDSFSSHFVTPPPLIRTHLSPSRLRLGRGSRFFRDNTVSENGILFTPFVQNHPTIQQTFLHFYGPILSSFRIHIFLRRMKLALRFRFLCDYIAS